MNEYWLTQLLNKALAPAVVWAGRAVGVTFAHPEAPIPDYISYLLLVFGLLVAFSTWLRRRLSVDNPGGLQHMIELLALGVRSLIDSVIGPHGRKYLPFHLSVGLFIFLCNIIGMIPGFNSPTSNINVTAGCAIVVFLHYNIQGIRANGLLRYLKHFLGPVIFIAPLMLVVEILSHLARPFSLSVRLFANIFGEHLILAVFTALLPFILPTPILLLSVFTSLIQAFVFVILSIVYTSEAVAHEEEHGHEAAPAH
jgi:F-type H+-transporting ATPase subunit a